MHVITKLAMATAGAALLTMGGSLTPAYAALLDFSFTATDEYEDGNISTQTGSFRLNTRTQEISNFGGVLNPEDGVVFSSDFSVNFEDSNTVLTAGVGGCTGRFTDENGNFLCYATSGFGKRLNLYFRGADLFNQLSSDSSVYENSFIPGLRRGLIDASSNNFFYVTGSRLTTLIISTELPSPVTALQVTRVETVPEPTMTAAMLVFSALGTGVLLKRKRATLVT